MKNSERLSCAAVLFAAAAHGIAAAQSGLRASSPAELGTRLVDQRALEIKQLHGGDSDVRAAADAMAAMLKKNPTVEESIPVVCPPAPAPAPRGMTTAIGSAKNWETRMPAEVDRAERALLSGPELTQPQKQILSRYVAPDFKKPGSSTKFEVISGPNCSGPAPSPLLKR